MSAERKRWPFVCICLRWRLGTLCIFDISAILFSLSIFAPPRFIFTFLTQCSCEWTPPPSPPVFFRFDRWESEGLPLPAPADAGWLCVGEREHGDVGQMAQKEDEQRPCRYARHVTHPQHVHGSCLHSLNFVQISCTFASGCPLYNYSLRNHSSPRHLQPCQSLTWLHSLSRAGRSTNRSSSRVVY